MTTATLETIALLVILVLLVGAVGYLWTTGKQMSWSDRLNRLETALLPKIQIDDRLDNLRPTLLLLVRVILIFAAMVVVWSITAGILSAGRWVSVTTANATIDLTVIGDHSRIVLFVIGAIVLAAKFTAVMALLTMASGIVGGLLGYVYALPVHDKTAAATVSTSTAHAAAGAGAGAAPTNADTSKAAAWAMNSNLMQIADWLTKTIVGVSLVEAHKIYNIFTGLCSNISMNLLRDAFGSEVVVPSVILGGGLLGFKLCNLYTQVVISRLIVDTFNKLNASEAVVTAMTPAWDADNRPEGIQDADEIAPAIHPRSEGRFLSVTNQQEPKLSDQRRLAAVEVSQRDLSDCHTAHEAWVWARANALLNFYSKAAEGYRKSLRLDPNPGPSVMFEAARVIARSGAFDALSAAIELLRKIRAGMDGTDWRRLVPVTRDLVELLFVQGNLAAALALLPLPVTGEPNLVQNDMTGELALQRARINAQLLAKKPVASDALEEWVQIWVDLVRAWKLYKFHSWILYLADPDAKEKPAPPASDREDDLVPVQVMVTLLEQYDKAQTDLDPQHPPAAPPFEPPPAQLSQSSEPPA